MNDGRVSWTEEEKRYLKQHWEHLSIQEMATHLNRSYASVKGQAGRMGLLRNDVKEIRRRKHKYLAPWTDAEIDNLRALCEARKYTCVEMALFLDRSENGVRAKIRYMKFPAPLSLGRHNFYTTEEEQLLLDMVKKGHTLDEIAFHLKRSVRGLKGKLIHMEKVKERDEICTEEL